MEKEELFRRRAIAVRGLTLNSGEVYAWYRDPLIAVKPTGKSPARASTAPSTLARRRTSRLLSSYDRAERFLNRAKSN
jgi:hypothetical protein